MRSLNSSFSLFSVCFTILCILGCKTGVYYHGYRDSANGAGATLWVQSFAPFSSSSFQQKCVHQRKQKQQQHHPHCHEKDGHIAWKPSSLSLSLPLPLPLYASNGSNGDESKSGAATAVVLSVFSKPFNTAFRELLAGSAKTTTDGNAELLVLKDIARWEELKEIVDDGDLTAQELRGLYDSIVDDGEGLDLEGFKRFYQSIDDLFDDDDDDDDDEDEDEENSDDDQDTPEGEEEEDKINVNDTEIESSSSSSSSNTNTKQDLVLYLEEVQNRNCDSEDCTVDVGERRPWGLDCTVKERKEISKLIEGLLAENRNSNIIERNNNGRPMTAKDLVKYILGTWDLTYTSSRTMIINKSLSGLGRSTSEMARNLGLTMTLTGSYYDGKAEFVEIFGTGPSVEAEEGGDSETDSVKLEATVAGEWILETGYKTGLPSVSLRVEVETIAYGPTKSAAGQWDSLSPIKLVDVLYLDENLMVLRGSFNVDAIFVYTRRR